MALFKDPEYVKYLKDELVASNKAAQAKDDRLTYDSRWAELFGSDFVGEVIGDILEILKENEGGFDFMDAEPIKQELADGLREAEGYTGGKLEAEVNQAFDELFDRGYRRVALIGSDSPDIPLANIMRAFTALKLPGAGSSGACGDDFGRLVLGPALDGGYYLIAMNADMQAKSSSIFKGVEWGGDSVLRRTLERAAQAGIALEMLPEWHDIDSFEDIALLKDRKGLPATRAILKALNIIP